MNVAIPPAKFTQGSILRHVIVMTGTGSIGLMAIFVVDLLSLLYVSRLGDSKLTAAVGFASQVLFFAMGINIGLTIAVSAIVSRALGAGRREEARRLAASSLVHVVVIGGVFALVVTPFRDDVLRLLGAQGETLEVASNFLAITLPANILMAFGVALSGVLRAAGEAQRAMYVTLIGGLVTAVTDPLFIFGFGFGVYGAAIATVISRVVFTIVGLYGAVYVRNLVARPQLASVIADLRPMMAIAIPAVATNLATPVATAYATRIFAQFGEPTIAAFAIIDRVTPLAFGAIFALSGAVGPIMGQNVGARLFDRVRLTLTNCFTLTIGFVIVVWALLYLASPGIIAIFDAKGRTAELISFYCTWGAAAWIFLGCLFVANAAFNNLDYAILSTVFNWGRATLGTIPFVTWGAAHYGPEGGMAGVIGGAAMFGMIAVFAAYSCVGRLAKRLQTR